MPRVALPCPRVLLECRSDLVGGSNLFSIVGEAASLVNTPTVGAQGITCSPASSERIDVAMSGMSLRTTPDRWTLAWAGTAAAVPPSGSTPRIAAFYGAPEPASPAYRGARVGVSSSGLVMASVGIGAMLSLRTSSGELVDDVADFEPIEDSGVTFSSDVDLGEVVIFSGADYMRIPAIDLPTAYELECEIKFDAFSSASGGHNTIFGVHDPALSGAARNVLLFGCRYVSSTTGRLELTHKGSGLASGAGPLLTAGVAYSVRVRVEDTALSVYLDDVEVATSSITALSPTGGCRVYLGADWDAATTWNEYFTGRMHWLTLRTLGTPIEGAWSPAAGQAFALIATWDGEIHRLDAYDAAGALVDSVTHTPGVTPELHASPSFELGRDRESDTEYWDGAHRAAAWYLTALNEPQRREWARRVLSRELLWPNPDPTLSRCLG